MTAELINTGSELLLGQVTNTHLPFLAKALKSLSQMDPTYAPPSRNPSDAQMSYSSLAA
jgi:hypothetical protein